MVQIDFLAANHVSIVGLCSADIFAIAQLSCYNMVSVLQRPGVCLSACACPKQQQILPIWEEHVATPHGREYTRPFRVLLSVQFPLQTSPITQSRVRYIHYICI